MISFLFPYIIINILHSIAYVHNLINNNRNNLSRIRPLVNLRISRKNNENFTVHIISNVIAGVNLNTHEAKNDD